MRLKSRSPSKKPLEPSVRPKGASSKEALGGLKTEFLEKLREGRRLLPSTLRIYDLELNRLLEILDESSPPSLAHELHRFAPATAARKLVIWRAFLKTCPLPWKELTATIENPKIRSRLPRFLDEDEIFRLESACYRSPQASRDRLFLALGLQLGLRVTEILQLRFEDFHGEWIRILRKGAHEQRLPLTTSLQSLIHFWKKEKMAQASDYVFEGRAGGPMSARNAQKLLQRLGKLAGIRNGIHPHALRHSFATRMASNGASLVALKEFLGHKRMSTTERYLHITPQHLKDSLRFLKVSDRDFKLK
jgi:integrase/recombinase XerC